MSLTAAMQQLTCTASVQVVMLELCRERMGMLQDQQSAEVCASPLQPLLRVLTPAPFQSCSSNVQGPTASEMVAAWRQGQAGLLQASLWYRKPGFLLLVDLLHKPCCNASVPANALNGMLYLLEVPSLRPQASCLLSCQPAWCCQVVPCFAAHLPMLPAYSAGSVCLDTGTAGCQARGAPRRGVQGCCAGGCQCEAKTVMHLALPISARSTPSHGSPMVRMHVLPEGWL